MEYKWYEIRKKIINACKKTFDEQKVNLNEQDIEASTDLFDRILAYHVSYHAVANLQAEIQQALQRAFIDNVGEVVDLKSLLSLLDSYLKKVLFLGQIRTIIEMDKPNVSLKSLLQFTNASTSFNLITNRIEITNIEQYNKDSSGAYIFCVTYLARNKVHESPNWDPEDVYFRLRYAMATYILVTHSLSTTIKTKIPNLTSNIKINLSEINDTGFVYDFINYGSTTNKIKNRIVESYILNNVYKKNSAVSVDSIVKDVIGFSRNSLTESSVKGMINTLIPARLQYDSSNKKNVILPEKEKTRISTAIESYTLAISRLLADIDNLFAEYGLKDKSRIIYEQLKKFFEDNCLSIIKILSEEDGEASNERSEDSIKEFKVFLKKTGCAEEKLDEVFRELLRICSLNDILVKISLGKNFTSISNPDAFTSGLKHREKKVYLDTQLLLYALCDYDVFRSYADSPSFVIVKNLVNTARNNQNIKLVTIDQYVNEAAYHLKRAVQLIPFDDIYHKSQIKLSDNVFYSYYYYLKENGFLEEGIDSLSDFLQELFNVSYEDLLQGNFESNVYSSLKVIIEDDFGIEVENTPRFSEEDISNSQIAFTTALLSRGDNRSPIAAYKDAIMGLHLFNNNYQTVSKPFFLSWDKAFSIYRKEYINKFQRLNVSSWLLFSPAKFVNHLNLLDMKIDIDVMTEDLISMIEDDDTANCTKRVLDSIHKLFEKSNVNSRQKRKAYSEIIFNETEFPNDTVIPDEKKFKLTNDFASAFDKLLTMMQSGNHAFVEFTGVLMDENKFGKIVTSIKKRLETEDVEACASATFNEILEEIKAQDNETKVKNTN